jgi:putative flippase GtrA
MASSAPGLSSRVRTMLPELIKFGVVGGIGSVIDLGGTAVLHSEYHVGPLLAKAIAVTVASFATYLGSRFWTFRHRESESGHREVILFIVLNVVGLVIAEAVIGLVVYVLGLHGKLEYNAASLIGTGLGTIFRFYTYRRFVFKARAEAPATAPLPRLPAFPDYPPWELDPSFLATAAAAPAAAAIAIAITGPIPVVPSEPAWNTDASAAAGPKTANSWDTAPIGIWGQNADWAPAAAPVATEPLSRRPENSSLPNGRAAAPQRHAAATGPIAQSPPPRPAGRHRRG